MSSTVSKAWKIIKPHVPMIQFKKGGHIHEVTSKITSANSTATGKNSPLSIAESVLPKKYFRKPISQIEIQTIELGGVQTL